MRILTTKHIKGYYCPEAFSFGISWSLERKAIIVSFAFWMLIIGDKNRV